MAKALALRSQFQKILTASPKEYLEQCCVQYIKLNPDDHSLFHQPLERLSELATALHRHSHIFLNTYGYAKEYRQLDKMSERIWLVEHCITDIILALLEGKELEGELSASRLEFQQYSDSELTI